MARLATVAPAGAGGCDAEVAPAPAGQLGADLGVRRRGQPGADVDEDQVLFLAAGDKGHKGEERGEAGADLARHGHIPKG